MKKIILILFLAITFIHGNSFATHMKAGEITYIWLNGLTYEATITTYTYTASLADRPNYQFFWGDGVIDTIPRIQKINLPNDVTENIYSGTHTFTSPGVYVLSMEDDYRTAGIINIPFSVEVPFYIFSMIYVFDPSIYCAVNSVNFFSPFPIIKQENDPHFKFNLTAFDVDHDSLSYELVPCKGSSGLDIAGYYIPEGVTLNPYNGEFSWDDSTSQQGEFCFAAKMTLASAVKEGAINTSTNCLATTSAALPSSSRLKAMMPPNADVGSVCKALL